jgi:hypothetical protein
MKRLSLLLLLAFAGCALLQPSMDQVDAVVRESVKTASAPVAEQKAVLGRAQQSFASDPAAFNRLRLATLLVTLPPPLRDDARAGELLEPLADADADSSIGRFAALLAGQIAEHQRLAREVDRLAKERAGLEKDRQERDKREEALRQQLEALRAIERGILDREERMRRKPAARP